jgi:hypothetical protein
LLVHQAVQADSAVLIIGDRKGPPSYPLDGTRFYSIAAQQNLPFELVRILPTDHYSRKNLGYLQAMSLGAASVYETDDDNAPMSNWKPRRKIVTAIQSDKQHWLNAYRYFSDSLIWPRGFPLDEVGSANSVLSSATRNSVEVVAPIQQGLANGSPDVDAVWRLVLDAPVEFEPRPSIWLPPGSWCPFNSQSTWWWPEAYPLMYLPSHCSFRVTDIWRSFVAQRCLWELGYGVVFHGPEVVQERNEHDLMRDFADEVSGYLRNKELARILSDLNLKPGAGSQGENLLLCYEALVSRQFFAEEEIRLVQTWLDDLAHIENSDGRTVA